MRSAGSAAGHNAVRQQQSLDVDDIDCQGSTGRVPVREIASESAASQRGGFLAEAAAEQPVEVRNVGKTRRPRDVLDLHPVELPVEQLLMDIAQAPFRDIIGECYTRFLEELLDVALTNPKF